VASSFACLASTFLFRRRVLPKTFAHARSLLALCRMSLESLPMTESTKAIIVPDR
jgi:hypothetical protein